VFFYKKYVYVFNVFVALQQRHLVSFDTNFHEYIFARASNEAAVGQNGEKGRF